MEWKNKRVLVTGSEGMIGKELVLQLRELKCKVYTCDIVGKPNIPTDLRYFEECETIVNNVDFVFHLAGIKGSPKMTNEKPADFMKMLQFDANMIYASQGKIKRFLYTSSIAVEHPETDKYPAWAKMTGEKLIEAMRIQYPVKYGINSPDKKYGTQWCIVRPANVYGRFDNFDNPNAMVVTSFISKMMKNRKLILDKKGREQVRDLINAKDVARGMIKCMEEMPIKPVNLCSGKGIKIKDIAKTIADELKNVELEYQDLNLTLGPNKKVMKNPYVKPQISLKEGIKEVIKWRTIV